MKTMLLTAAVLALASPAMAQSDPGMMVRAQAAPPSSAVTGSIGATRAHARSAVNPTPNAVYDEYGQQIGADPDPNIRSQLYREHDSLGF